MRKVASILSIILFIITLFISCSDDDDRDIVKDPNNAELASVDRFSDNAAVLMKRSENSSLPAANAAINYDEGLFITQGLGPIGEIVKYYNFDVQPLTPAPLYMLFREGEQTAVEDQLNVINVIPGDVGYSDFWVIYNVIVPNDYEANTVSSYNDITKKGYIINKTNEVFNCPVVPVGSTANLRYGTENSELHRGWYKDKIVYYFTFMEKKLLANTAGLMPISPIYVTFNLNPDDLNPNSGPPSGDVTEPESLQTHSVLATLPNDSDYSPLWSVYVYDNSDFDLVSDLTSAENATILIPSAMYVNCPVVFVEP
jgi:hypothetical protein